MKRHRTLVPLSHDHHHALVEAGRLRCAAEGPGSSTAASAFLRFFASETVCHFRAEEDLLFPTVIDFPEAREPIIQALLEHQHIRARAALLRERLDDRRALAEIMRELGELLAAHIRHEERRLFPLIESLLDDGTLAAVELSRSDCFEAADAQGALSGRTTPADPDATLLFWGAGLELSVTLRSWEPAVERARTSPLSGPQGVAVLVGSAPMARPPLIARGSRREMEDPRAPNGVVDRWWICCRTAMLDT